ADSVHDLLGNEEVARQAGVEARQTGGTVVARAGDSVSGLALKGTGDAQRYRELNTFNGRAAEDASLEQGDILDVPVGWDIEAMGGSPPVAPSVPASPAVAEPAAPQGWDLAQVVAMGRDVAAQGTNA